MANFKLPMWHQWTNQEEMLSNTSSIVFPLGDTVAINNLKSIKMVYDAINHQGNDVLHLLSFILIKFI